jgi:hypothetical protein
MHSPADRDPFAPPEPRPPVAGAPPAAREPTATLSGALVDRDPHARAEETADWGATGAVSFEDVLRRARRHSFVSGCLAGGAAVAAFCLVTWALFSTTPVTTREVRAERAEPAAGTAEPVAAAPAQRPGAGSASAATSRPAGSPAGGATAARGAPGRARDPVRSEVTRSPAAAGAPAEVAAAVDDPAAAPLEPAASGAAAGAAAGVETAAGSPRPGEREVMAALRDRGEAIDECVALTPGDETAARGRRFQLLVVVEPAGEVSDVRVADPSVESTPLGVCLVRLGRELSFPPFEGEAVRVELPVRYGRSE